MNYITPWQNTIEYTNLHGVSSVKIKNLVNIANKENYYGVCIPPGSVPVASKYRNQDLKIITVAGFPPIHKWLLYRDNKDPRLNFYLGHYTKQEIDKIKYILDNPDVDELDLVFPMLWYASGKFARISTFFKGIKQRFKRPIKVITELGTIFKDPISLFEIVDLLEQSGVDFFKTNTGLIPCDFNLTSTGIQLVKKLKPNIRIKASGGIRTLSQVKFLMSLGVERIGTSNLINDIPNTAPMTGQL